MQWSKRIIVVLLSALPSLLAGNHVYVVEKQKGKGYEGIFESAEEQVYSPVDDNEGDYRDLNYHRRFSQRDYPFRFLRTKLRGSDSCFLKK